MRSSGCFSHSCDGICQLPASPPVPSCSCRGNALRRCAPAFDTTREFVRLLCLDACPFARLRLPTRNKRKIEPNSWNLRNRDGVSLASANFFMAPDLMLGSSMPFEKYAEPLEFQKFLFDSVHLLQAMISHSDEGHGVGNDHDHDHKATMWKGLAVLLGIVFFFFTEKFLNLGSEWRKKRQRSKNVSFSVKRDKLSNCRTKLLVSNPRKRARILIDLLSSLGSTFSRPNFKWK